MPLTQAYMAIGALLRPKPCDVHIDTGKPNLPIRKQRGRSYGIAKVICPLEIESERKKWEEFLAAETRADLNAKKTK